jgi:hypothetical protein
MDYSFLVYSRWLTQANNDLTAAKSLMTVATSESYNWVCATSHQVCFFFNERSHPIVAYIFPCYAYHHIVLYMTESLYYRYFLIVDALRSW